MSESITITGISKTAERLDELDRKMQKSIIRKGVRAGCKVWLNAARANAPEVSGVIRKNIKIRSGGSGKGRYVLTVGVSAKEFQGEAFYAAFVLYGHKVGSRKLGDARTSVPANNFLQRAFDSSHDEAAYVAIETIGDLIQQEA